MRVLDVMPPFKVCDEAGMCWPPAGLLAGERARGGDVGREEGRQPAEVLGCVPGSDGAHRASRWRPITSAMSRTRTPSSATPCRTLPPGADSSASRIGARHPAGEPRASGWRPRRRRQKGPWCEQARSRPGRRRGRPHREPTERAVRLTSGRRGRRGRALSARRRFDAPPPSLDRVRPLRFPDARLRAHPSRR
jgi:hypothetical protein